MRNDRHASCPKCGAIGRRQAYPAGTEPPQEWLCESYIEAHGDVIIKKGEFIQSDECRIAALAAEVARLKNGIRDMANECRGRATEWSSPNGRCLYDVIVMADKFLEACDES